MTNKKYDGIYALKKLLNLNRIDRFKDEVYASFHLQHPNIINVIDYNCDTDHPFLVMDYYEKGSLENIDVKTFSTEKKFEIFRKVCEAVAFAHKNNPTVIHRDLKPGNIFLNNEFDPVVGDFGLCFFDDEGDRLTFTDEAVGSRYYMAPELEEGRTEDISPASDVYALGKILYWLLTGNIFAREKLHDPKYDLAVLKPCRESYLLNELLDKMIVFESIKRFKNGNAVLNEFESIVKRINMGNNSIGSEIPQTCIYCGKGSYKQVVHNEPGDNTSYNELKNKFGWTSVGSTTWIIFVCDYCANVQIFRPNLSKGENLWKKD